MGLVLEGVTCLVGQGSFTRNYVAFLRIRPLPSLWVLSQQLTQPKLLGSETRAPKGMVCQE